MCALCALGALTFAATFWEQSRTGSLILPAVGPTEGVTALVLVEVSVALLGDPDWLRVTLERPTAGTALVLVLVAVHAVALLPPLVRARRRGISLGDVAPLFAATIALVGYAVLGAPGPLVGSTIGLTCAHFVCQLVVARHVREPWGKRSIAWPALVAPLLPLPLSFFWREGVLPCAALALVLSVAAYARSLHLGWRKLGPLAGHS
jgi:hypothetical protein